MTFRLIIATASMLALVACSRSDPPPTPRTEAPASGGAPAAVSPADTPRAPEAMPAPRVQSTAPPAADASATQPLSTLNKAEEQNSMPMAGHGNSHSSPALEPKKDPGKS